MPRPMRRYKIAAIKHPEHSFRKDGLYCHYGKVKGYANKTQAENKIIELRELGFKVNRSMDHPFTIIQEEVVCTTQH